MTTIKTGRPVEAPPGWTTNPSAWSERLPIVALALVGTGVACTSPSTSSTLWERFGNRSSVTAAGGSSTPRCRTSCPSHAALGAAGYMLDAVTGLLGGADRWRRWPWLVIVFGVAVGPLGVASVVLVILQPVLFDAFCTLCLASAVISVAMIGPALDEVLAGLQFIRRESGRGRSAWDALWEGARP